MALEEVGLGITDCVHEKTREDSAAWARNLGEGIEAMSPILECHRIGGEVGCLPKVVAPDNTTGLSIPAET